MTFSKISQDQWFKVLRAATYSFVSGAITVLIATNYDFSKKSLLAVLVAGTNSILVLLKQSVTPAS